MTDTRRNKSRPLQ